MDGYIDIIGYCAGIGTTVSFLPQVILCVRTGRVRGISPYMFVIHSSGVICWIVYGSLLHNTIILVFNGITLLLNSIILGCFLRESWARQVEHMTNMETHNRPIPDLPDHRISFAPQE